MEHGADQNKNEVGPWKADVKQSTTKCGGSDSVFILATVVGKAVICLRFESLAEKKICQYLLLMISETLVFNSTLLLLNSQKHFSVLIFVSYSPKVN